MLIYVDCFKSFDKHLRLYILWETSVNLQKNAACNLSHLHQSCHVWLLAISLRTMGSFRSWTQYPAAISIFEASSKFWYFLTFYKVWWCIQFYIFCVFSLCQVCAFAWEILCILCTLIVTHVWEEEREPERRLNHWKLTEALFQYPEQNQ